MAQNVKGEEAIDILRRPEIVKCFTDADNPVSKNVINRLSQWFLNVEDKQKIERAEQNDGSTSAAAALHECLIKHYKDEPDKFTLGDFIEVLNNQRTNVKLAQLLTSAADGGTGKAPGSDSLSKLESVIQHLKQKFSRNFSRFAPVPNVHKLAYDIEEIWVGPLFENITQRQEPTDYMNCLIDALNTSLIVICKGDPGSGKTTTMRKMAYDWSVGRVAQYDLFICAKLREVTDKSGSSILDLSLEWMERRRFLTCSEVGLIKKLEGQMTGVPRLDGSKSRNIHTLVFLDGWDEANQVICNQLVKTLQQFEMPNLSFALLITSRPWAVNHLMCPAEFIEILGFYEEQQDQYIDNHFKKTPDHARQIQAVKLKLKENLDLREVGQTPLLLSYICLVHDQLRTNTVVELHMAICNYLTVRYEKEKGNEIGRLLTKDWQISHIIENLGKLALSGFLGTESHGATLTDLIFKIRSSESSERACSIDLDELTLDDLSESVDDNFKSPDKLIFSEDDLTTYNVDQVCSKIGLLVKDEFLDEHDLSPNQTLSFSHKSMQEFFAAVLIYAQLLHTVEEYLNKLGLKTDVILSDLAEVLQENSILKKIQGRSGDCFCSLQETDNFLTQIVYESHLDKQKETITKMSLSLWLNMEVFSWTPSRIYSGNANTNFLKLVQKYTGISPVDQELLTNIHGYLLSPGNLEVIIQVVDRLKMPVFSMVNQHVLYIADLSLLICLPNVPPRFRKVPNLAKPKEMSVSACVIHEQAINYFATLVNDMSLDAREIIFMLTHDTCSDLEILSTCTPVCVTNLEIVINTDKESGSITFPPSFKSFLTLLQSPNSVGLFSNHHIVIEHLVDVFKEKSWTDLTLITLYRVGFGKSVDAFIDQLQRFELHMLRLEKTQLDDQSLIHLTDTTATSLSVLEISGESCLQDSTTFKKWCATLKGSLYKQLNIMNNGIQEGSLLQLADVLCTMPQLESIRLEGNCVTAAVLDSIAEKLATLDVFPFVKMYKMNNPIGWGVLPQTISFKEITKGPKIKPL